MWLDWGEYSSPRHLKRKPNEVGKVEHVRFVGHCEICGFYSEGRGKPLQDFEQRSNTIRFTFLNDHWNIGRICEQQMLGVKFRNNESRQKSTALIPTGERGG